MSIASKTMNELQNKNSNDNENYDKTFVSCRTRRQRQCHVSYYAVRASDSSNAIDEPIIFFGWKDLNLFEQYLQQQQHQQQSICLNYQQFDKLADAIQYLYGQEEQKKGKEPKRSEQQQQVGASNEGDDDGSISKAKVRNAESKEDSEVNGSDMRTDDQDEENLCKTRQGKQPQQRSHGQSVVATATTTAESSCDVSNDTKPKSKCRARIPWDTYFELLLQFKKDYGHANVPSDPKVLPKDKYKRLIRWTRLQRMTLSQEQLDKMDNGIQKEQAKNRRQRLMDIGYTYLDKPLQKRSPKKRVTPSTTTPKAATHNTPPEEDDSESDNDDGDSKSRAKRRQWETYFALLEEYQHDYGHVKVPADPNQIPNKKYRKLSRWLRIQRQELSHGFQTMENQVGDIEKEATRQHRRQRLQSIGYMLLDDESTLPTKLQGLAKRQVLQTQHKSAEERRQERFDQVFQKNLERIQEFKQKHGHVNIPSQTSLYSWLNKTRTAYAQARKDQERQKTTIDDNQQQPQQLLEKEETTAIISFKKNKKLPYHTLLKVEHISALANLGISIVPNYKRRSLRESILEYVDFVKTHDGKFPSEHSTDSHQAWLGRTCKRWKQQRRLHENHGITKHADYGNCVIPPDLIADLDGVKFDWGDMEKYTGIGKKRPPGLKAASTSTLNMFTPWQVKCDALEAYIKQHNGAEPTVRDKDLGMFVKEQRKEYRYMMEGKRTRLTLERFRKLTEIGFRFKVGTSNRRTPGRSVTTMQKLVAQKQKTESSQKDDQAGDTYNDNF